MPPLPKRKLSKGRRDRRRSQDFVSTPNLVICPQCKHKHVAHHVCPNCGHYNGRQAVPIKDEGPAPTTNE